MGCCISKCRSQHNNIKNVVQDKLVISQQVSPPIIPSPIISPNNPHHHHRFLPPSKYKISPSPPSPTSSFTCTAATTTTTISSSSSSSLSSASSFTSKDRSFSNEFLWSCYKDNPQITRINSLTHHAATSLPFSNNQKPNKTTINVNPSPPPPPPHSLLNHRLPGSSSSQKRLRSNSPTNLTRQKSFRKDSSQQQPQLESINSNRPLRMLIGSSPSPSPSRRFTEYSGNSSSMDNTTSIVSKRRNNNGNNSPKVISSVHHSYSRCSSSNSVRNSNKAAVSPNNSASLGRLQCSGLRHRAMTRTLRVGSKIDENVVKQVVSNANNNNDMDLDIIEDIDNPLISLDCFIFL